jgi:uncharacterized protein YjiS (DUF1127 family)
MSFRPLSQRTATGVRWLSFDHGWRLLARWGRRRRQRVDLAELDDHLLADIGKTREETRRESTRPFWR